MAQMCQAALDGNAEEALKIDQQIAELHRVLFLESNPIPVKWAVSQMGLCENIFRLPMTPLSEKYHETLRKALIAAGVL